MYKMLIILLIIIATSALAGHVENERITIAIEKMDYLTPEFSKYNNVGRMIERMLTTACASYVTDYDFKNMDDMDKLIQEQLTTIQFGGSGPQPGRIKRAYYKIIGDYSIIGGKIIIDIRFRDCETGNIDNNKSFIVEKLYEPEEELEQAILTVLFNMLKRFDIYLSNEQKELIEEQWIIPKASKEHLLHANNYYDCKNYDAAINEINLCIKNNAKCIEAYILQGLIYYDQQNYDMAFYSFNKALDINKHDPCALYDRGNYYFKMRRFEDARTDYENAIEANSGYVDAYRALGTLYWQGFEDASDLAEQNFLNALSLTNYTHPDTLLLYSAFLIEKKRFPDAKKLLNNYRRVWVNTAVYNNLADVLLKQCQ